MSKKQTIPFHWLHSTKYFIFIYLFFGWRHSKMFESFGPIPTLWHGYWSFLYFQQTSGICLFFCTDGLQVFPNVLFHLFKRKVMSRPIQLLNWIHWRFFKWDKSRANTKWQFINIECTLCICVCVRVNVQKVRVCVCDTVCIIWFWMVRFCDQIDVNIYFKPINCITLALPSLLSLSSSSTLGYPIKWQWRRNIHIFNIVLICLPENLLLDNQMFVSFDNPCERTWKSEWERVSEREREREREREGNEEVVTIMSFDAPNPGIYILPARRIYPVTLFENVWKWIQILKFSV